jgi:TPP-dependent pyruvate/acetoin dehydrogenase alpha subunit
MRDEIEHQIREAIEAEEPTPPPLLHTLIEDVFAEVPTHLEAQLRAIEPLPRQKTGGIHT